MNTAKKILISPLDWGLGHTTRCIPLIHCLLEQQCEVIIASDGAPARLLKDNFPGIQILELAGYNIRYSQHPDTFAAAIIAQVPKILNAIKREHRWLQQAQQQYRFDAVISDNRYGMYLEEVPSVIMTHQLQVKTGKGSWVDRVLQKMHYRLLQRFNDCWVVDNEKEPFLAGMLSHPGQLPTHARYIGLLSQLKAAGNVAQNKRQILVLLSGPEPMRSMLEEKLLMQAKELTEYRFVFAAGNPLGKLPETLPAHIAYHTHLDAKGVTEHMVAADLVICRSGYSTLMDLAFAGKKALLIPTPGQTEQEYLAKVLAEKQVAYAVNQGKLLPELHIPAAMTFRGFDGFFDHSYTAMRLAVRDLLRQIE